ncbi:hypothetical protein NMY22_g17586 [Coprinellus aureogranulatus]|nr:hypothetical protein NMY22_g17586 [Coprinellus aureogranulatus]
MQNRVAMSPSRRPTVQEAEAIVEKQKKVKRDTEPPYWTMKETLSVILKEHCSFAIKSTEKRVLGIMFHNESTRYSLKDIRRVAQTLRFTHEKPLTLCKKRYVSARF